MLGHIRWLIQKGELGQDVFLVGAPGPHRRRLALWYALHSDSSLDVEEIFRHLQTAPQLKQTTMSVAEKLIARGEARGEARGRADGEATGQWIGRLQLLEEMMGTPVTPGEVLRALSLEELELRYRACQQRYSERFKSTP